MENFKIKLIEFSGLASVTAVLGELGKTDSTTAFTLENKDDIYNTVITKSIVHLGLGDYNKANDQIRQGDSCAPYMRALSVTVRIAAPLEWWAEFETYKIGTELIYNGTPSNGHQVKIKVLNYQMLRRVYLHVRDKDDFCWKEFCEFVKGLPFSEFIIIR